MNKSGNLHYHLLVQESKAIHCIFIFLLVRLDVFVVNPVLLEYLFVPVLHVLKRALYRFELFNNAIPFSSNDAALTTSYCFAACLSGKSSRCSAPPLKSAVPKSSTAGSSTTPAD